MDNSKPVIGVFCGSSHGSDAAYARDARQFGALLAAHGFNMVFGGGYIGLMGEVAHAAREGGAYITGVLPDFLRHLEPPSHDAHRMIVTPDLTERKKLMLSMADGFAVLPGGLGTLDEFFEVITAVQLKVFDKPIVLLDSHGFYAPLDALIDQVVAKDLAGERIKAFYRRAPTPEQAIAYLAERVPSARRSPPG